MLMVSWKFHRNSPTTNHYLVVDCHSRGPESGRVFPVNVGGSQCRKHRVWDNKSGDSHKKFGFLEHSCWLFSWFLLNMLGFFAALLWLFCGHLLFKINYDRRCLALEIFELWGLGLIVNTPKIKATLNSSKRPKLRAFFYCRYLFIIGVKTMDLHFGSSWRK